MSDFPMHIWNALAEKDERILGLEADLSNSASRIAEKDAENMRLLKIIHERDTWICEKDARIAALTEALRTVEDRAEGLMEDGVFRAQTIRDIARAALTPEDRG